MSLVVNDELTMNTDRVRRDLYGSLRYSYSLQSLTRQFITWKLKQDDLADKIEEIGRSRRALIKQ